MSESKILVGYEAEVAEEARVRLFHMILTGITQHGKTEELKRLVTEAQLLGYTVLILDVKDKPEGEKGDFEGFGVDVPIYLAGIADTLSIYGLLESHSNLPLRRELPELARACKRGKTLRRAYEILKQLLSEEKIHPVRKDRIEILVLVLEGLIAEMDIVKPSSKLQLKKGKINVMTLRGRSMGFKQLAVNDATAYIRKYYKKIILAFDEAHQQIPQAYGSGSKRTVTSAIKEGAGSQQYIWVADQTIKEIDKDVIAQIPIKIYGGQPGAKLRAKETLDHLPVKTWRDRKINEEFIMQLNTGFFILGERDRTRLVYALPLWMPGPLGRLVAEGKCSPEVAKEICDQRSFEEIMRGVTERRVEIKPEEDQKQIQVLREELKRLQHRYDSVLQQVKELEEKADAFDAAKKSAISQGKMVDVLQRKLNVTHEIGEKRRLQIKNLTKQLKAAEEAHNKAVQLVQDLQEKLKHFEYLEEGLHGILEPYLRELFKVARETAPMKVDVPAGISVTTEQPAISVKQERPPLELTDKKLQGRIAIVYSEGALGDDWFSVSDVVRAFQRHAWPRDPRISKALDEFCHWGYFEKRKDGRKLGYKVRLKPEEAEAKGLLKIEEVKVKG